MRDLVSDQGAEPACPLKPWRKGEAKPKLLLRIRQRRAEARDPFAARPTFSTGC